MYTERARSCQTRSRFILTNFACPITNLADGELGLRYGTVIRPQADSESWQSRLKRCFWFNIINEWLRNMQLFPKIWILEISKKAFRISASGSRLIAVLDIRIRLQTHYPAGYPTDKRDSDHHCQRWSDSGFSLSDPILFLKSDIRIRSESCLVEIILSVSDNYPKVYCDVRHTFLCCAKITSGAIFPLAKHDWLK